MTETPSEGLVELARSYGVQVEYVGMDGKTAPAPPRSLLAVLRALGAEIDAETDATAALVARKRALWQRRVEPVIVAWDGLLQRIEVRIPEALLSSSVHCSLANDDHHQEWKGTVLRSETGP